MEQTEEQRRRAYQDAGVAMPPLSPLPTQPQSQAPTLPNTQRSGNNLVTFKDAMESAMNLARQKRDDLMQQFMIPHYGTMAANDFNSLFNQMSRASDVRSEATLEKVIPSGGDIVTFQDDFGNVYGVDKNTGEQKWEAKGVAKKKAEPTITLAEKKAEAFGNINKLIKLKKSSGGFVFVDDNGYFTPEGFKKIVENAIEDNISKDEILKQYGNYLDPDLFQNYGLTMKEQMDLQI